MNLLEKDTVRRLVASAFMAASLTVPALADPCQIITCNDGSTNNSCGICADGSNIPTTCVCQYDANFDQYYDCHNEYAPCPECHDVNC